LPATPRTPSPPESFAVPCRLLFGVCLLSCLILSDTFAKPRDSEVRPEPLEVELAAVFDDDGAPGAGVTVTMPYRMLVFRRGGDGFRSELRVTVSVLRAGRVVAGGIESGAAIAADYAGTRSGDRLRVTVPVSLAGDREVELRVIAEVVGTSRWWERRMKFSPGAARDIPWAFAGFEWNLPDDPEQGLRLDATVDSVRVDVELIRRPASSVANGRPTSLVIEILDGHGASRELARRPLEHPPERPRMIVKTVLDGRLFPFGLQTLAVRLEDDRGGVLAMVPDHPLVNLGIPFFDLETWRRHVGWLDHASTDEDDLDAMASLPVKDRAAAWRAFWDGRRPGATLSETEHLLRIVDADRRFGRFGRGAMSDRGRYLIRYGSPDNVDVHVMDRRVPGDWEVWYYRARGFKVIFHDAYGLGDFREYARWPL